jgi:hypothetical protein
MPEVQYEKKTVLNKTYQKRIIQILKIFEIFTNNFTAVLALLKIHNIFFLKIVLNTIIFFALLDMLKSKLYTKSRWPKFGIL